MQTRTNEPQLETANRLRIMVARHARLPAVLTVEDAVEAVMCVFAERLTAGGAREVLRDVPSAIASMFEVCASHRQGRAEANVDRAEFIAKVADHLDVTPAHAELVASAVLTAVRAELPSNTVMAVGAQLPHGLKELWLGPPVAAPDLDVDVRPEDARRAIEAELLERAELPETVTPERAFTAVMCSFARRLSAGETRHVLLGLPPKIRVLMASCAVHVRSDDAALFGRDELYRDVARHLGTEPGETVRIVTEVLRAAKRMLPQQVIAEVDAQLPMDLRALWQEALPAHLEG